MTTTHVGRSLLLLVVLAVSWAAAVPLPQVSSDDHLIQDAQTFLEQHPFIARELYPHLLNEATGVRLTLDRDVVQDLLKDYLAAQRIDQGNAQAEEEHERMKRETSVDGDVYRVYHPRGHSDSASGTLTHSLDDNHAISGTLGATRDTIPGLGSLDSLTAGGAYSYSPRDDTTFTIGGSRTWRPDGITNTNAGATLEHSLTNTHSLRGTIEAIRTDIPGFDSINSHRGELNFDYTPNRDTRFSLGAHTSRSPFGNDYGFGGTFTHMFGG